MEKDYSKLEGRIVYFPVTSRGAANGRVIGCDPDIGITITDLLDDNRYLLCLLGPLAPQRKTGNYYNNHVQIFLVVVELIEKGTIDYSALYDLMHGVKSGEPTVENCAFGQ